MKLKELEAEFVGKLALDGKSYEVVGSMAEAQGVLFICPKCMDHSVLCWFKDRGIPDTQDPKPGRWIPSGTGLDDLTLAPSIDLSHSDGCKWHGWVKGGEAT